eukprot:406914-Rhodomonas_salina.5
MAHRLTLLTTDHHAATSRASEGGALPAVAAVGKDVAAPLPPPSAPWLCGFQVDRAPFTVNERNFYSDRVFSQLISHSISCLLIHGTSDTPNLKSSARDRIPRTTCMHFVDDTTVQASQDTVVVWQRHSLVQRRSHGDSAAGCSRIDSIASCSRVIGIAPSPPPIEVMPGSSTDHLNTEHLVASASQHRTDSDDRLSQYRTYRSRSIAT